MELHINTNQRRNMSKRGVEALGEDLVKRSHRKRKYNARDMADLGYVNDVLDQCLEIGLQPYRAGQNRNSDFWKPYRDCYEHLFPTLQDWLNQYHGQPDGTIVTKEDYLDWMVPQLPKGVMQLGHYVCAQNYSLCKKIAEETGQKWNHNMSFYDLLLMAWDDNRIHFSPGNLWGFQYAVDEDETPYWDESGDCYLIWSGGDGYPLDRTVVVLEHPELSLQLVET